MTGDDVKPSIRSGKLSLKKRRREKRNSDKSHEDSSTVTNTKRSKRAPIPSFSPLDDDCSFLFGNGEKEMAASGPHKTVKKAISPDSNKDAGIGMKKTHANKQTQQLERPLKELNRRLPREQNADQKTSATQPNSNVHKKEKNEVQKQDLEKVKDSLPMETPERFQMVGGASIHSTVNTVGCAVETVFEAAAKTMLSSDKSNPQQAKKIGGDNCSDKSLQTVAIKLDANKHSTIAIRASTEMYTIISTKVNDIELIESKSEIMASITPKDGLLPPSKRKQQTMARYSASSKSTNSMNDVSPNPSLNSPGFKDFNVPRAKFLADKESNLNQTHCNLLQQSKNGKINRNSSAKRSKNSKTAQYGQSSGDKQCTLCATCSCSRGSALQSLEDSAISEHQNPLQRLARSDAEIERAFIGRLARLEKSASWFDGLCTKVHRDLKRHRNKIKAKMQEADVTDRPKFLRDVDLDDEGKFCAPALSKKFVDMAKNRTFSFRKKAQPTLTQMLGGESGDGEQSDVTNKLEIIVEDCETLAEEEDVLSKRSEGSEAEEGVVDYTGARDKGQSRSLWGASRMSEEQLQETKIMQDFNPIASGESALDQQTNYDDNGLSELLNAFEATEGDHCNGFVVENVSSSNLCETSTCLNNDDSSKSLATFSQLSPYAKSTYTSMKLKVEADPAKIETLNCECPGWKENMRFALRQNPDELREALANVKIKRDRIKKAMQMLEKQSTVLDVFQLTLQESLGRHDASSKLDFILQE